jgi:hypothetical protein
MDFNQDDKDINVKIVDINFKIKKEINNYKKLFGNNIFITNKHTKR